MALGNTAQQDKKDSVFFRQLCFYFSTNHNESHCNLKRKFQICYRVKITCYQNKMCARLTEELKVQIRTLTELKWSYSRISSFFKSKKLKVYPRDISKVVKEAKNSDTIVQKPENRGRRMVLTLRQRYGLKAKLLSIDPPTQSQLAKHYNVSQQTICNYVRKLGLKKYTKPRNHKLTAKEDSICFAKSKKE